MYALSLATAAEYVTDYYKRQDILGIGIATLQNVTWTIDGAVKVEVTYTDMNGRYEESHSWEVWMDGDRLNGEF